MHQQSICRWVNLLSMFNQCFIFEIKMLWSTDREQYLINKLPFQPVIDIKWLLSGWSLVLVLLFFLPVCFYKLNNKFIDFYPGNVLTSNVSFITIICTSQKWRNGLNTFARQCIWKGKVTFLFNEPLFWS